jgi:hypothetical protein
VNLPLAAGPGETARLTFVQKVRLGLETLLAYGRVRRALKCHDLPTTLAVLRAPLAGAPVATFEDAGQAGRRLARVATRTLSVLPSDSRCLMRSLTLTALLARRGLPTQLVISVTTGGGFGAHAWIEHAGTPLLPATSPGHERLVTL